MMTSSQGNKCTEKVNLPALRILHDVISMRVILIHPMQAAKGEIKQSRDRLTSLMKTAQTYFLATGSQFENQCGQP